MMKVFSFRSIAMLFMVGLVVVMFVVASCGGGDDAAQVIADEFVSISGTITDFNGTGESGIEIEGVYFNPGDSLNPVTATDADGNFSLQVLKNDAVYLHASKTSFAIINTARAPLSANVTGIERSIPTETEAQSVIDTAFDHATPALANHAWLIVDVEDANGNEVSGHTISSTPAPIDRVYTNCDGTDSGGVETMGPCVPGRPGTMYIAYFDSPVDAKVTVGSETQSAPIRMGEVTVLEFEVAATPVNEPPVAANDVLNAVQGGTTNLNLAINDSGVDDGLDLASITIVTAPVHADGAVVVKSDGTVDYTHDGTATTSDTFTYTIKDNSGAVSNTATVTLTITAVPVNNPPVAVNDDFYADHNDTTNLNLAKNDYDADDGLDLASITIETDPSHGTIVNNINGTVDYIHNGTVTTSDMFTYTIKDITGALSNTATVTLTIVTNNPPVADAGADQAVVPGQTVILDGSGSSDPDGDGLTYYWDLQSKPAQSLSLLSSTLVNPSFTPDFYGSYTIRLVVNDGTVDSPADTVVVTASTAGQRKYDEACASCHKAGRYDLTGSASDLYDDGEKLRTDLSAIKGMKNVPDITQQELLDLNTFLEDPLIAP